MTPMLRIDPSALEAGFGHAPFRVAHVDPEHNFLLQIQGKIGRAHV